MKTVIIICLLSFSMCLGLPSGENGTNQQNAPLTPNASGDSTKATTGKPPISQETPTHNETVTEVTPSAALNTTEPKKNETVSPATPAEGTTENNTEPAGDKKKTTDDKTVPIENQSEPNKTEQAITNKTVTPVTVPTITTVKPDDKDEKKTTSPTTVVVNAPTTPTPTLQSRAFDGPSFIGGIILTMGLLAIGFIGFKYYKNPSKNLYTTF